MARVKFFAGIREAAGTGEADIAAPTLGRLIDEVRRQFGTRLSDQLASAAVAVNGVELSLSEAGQTPLNAGDEVAFLPPASGGAG